MTDDAREACDECGAIHGPSNTNSLCPRASNYDARKHARLQCELSATASNGEWFNAGYDAARAEYERKVVDVQGEMRKRLEWLLRVCESDGYVTRSYVETTLLEGAPHIFLAGFERRLKDERALREKAEARVRELEQENTELQSFRQMFSKASDKDYATLEARVRELEQGLVAWAATPDGEWKERAMSAEAALATERGQNAKLAEQNEELTGKLLEARMKLVTERERNAKLLRALSHYAPKAEIDAVLSATSTEGS